MTLAAAKTQVNRLGMPTAAELQSSNDLSSLLLALSRCAGASCEGSKPRLRWFGATSN